MLREKRGIIYCIILAICSLAAAIYNIVVCVTCGVAICGVCAVVCLLIFIEQIVLIVLWNRRLQKFKAIAKKIHEETFNAIYRDNSVQS